MSGRGRGVRLEDGESSVVVRAKFPISLKAGMDQRVKQLNEMRDPDQRPIDGSAYLRDLVAADIAEAPPLD